MRKDTILFRIGDIGDKFFIIFSGKLNIMKPMEEQVLMKAEEYLYFLKKMYDEDEAHIVKMTINENQQLFPVDIKDIQNIEEIVFRIKYRKLLMNNPNLDAVINIFEEYERDIGVEIEFDPIGICCEYIEQHPHEIVHSYSLEKDIDGMNQDEMIKYLENYLLSSCIFIGITDSGSFVYQQF